MPKDLISNLEDKLYNTREVAEILRVSVRTIYRYIELKKIVDSYRTPTDRHMFTKKDIQEFLIANEDKVKSITTKR